MNNQKKYILSGLVLVSFVGYAFFIRHQENEADESRVIAPKISATNLPTMMRGNNMMSNKQYKNGVYISSVTDAIYGPLQIEVTISDGKISGVKFLKYPNDRDRSIQINTQAMPYLKQEAIAAQIAKVDIVSGATQTSLAFREAMTSVLLQAK